MRPVRSFSRSEDGNIAILFVFLLGVLLLFTGGAVDFSRRNAVRADLIESLDAAGLAIAQLDEANSGDIASLSGAEREEYLKEYGERFFYENFKYEHLIEDLDLDFDINEQVITPTAQGHIKTLFLGIGSTIQAKRSGGTGGFANLSMTSSTEITRRGSGPIELALVLDVTGSMSDKIDNVKKIQSLRDASDALLDVLYGDDDDATSDYVRTSVIPFNAYVNAGAATDDDDEELWDADWSDANAGAVYHGKRFYHTTSAGAVDMATKVNHFTLFNSMTATDWKGCFEERPYPLDEIDVASGAAAAAGEIDDYDQAPSGVTNTLVLSAFSTAPDWTETLTTLTTAANTKFVPMFVPDQADCNNSQDCAWGSTNYTLNGVSYNGGWFDSPASDGEGHDNSDYRSWIDDRRYTNRSYTDFPKYLPVVNYARRVLGYHVGFTCSTSPNTTQQDDGFYSWLAANGASECGEDEYVSRQGYVGQYNATTLKYEGKLNLSSGISIDETIDEASGDETTTGPNRGCTSPILAWSDEKDAIHDHIHALAPAGNTNSAEGMMWGWRVLSPEAPFESDIPYNDNEWQKAVVLMTDGFNTVSDLDTHMGSDQSAYGYAIEERMGSGVDTAAEMKDELDNKLLRICARMKAKGILIYAITFGLSDDDADELATKETFQACASEPEAPYYFDAPDGEDLEDAFADIAADLVQLHVSR